MPQKETPDMLTPATIICICNNTKAREYVRNVAAAKIQELRPHVTVRDDLNADSSKYRPLTPGTVYLTTDSREEVDRIVSLKSSSQLGGPTICTLEDAMCQIYPYDPSEYTGLSFAALTAVMVLTKPYKAATLAVIGSYEGYDLCKVIGDEMFWVLFQRQREIIAADKREKARELLAEADRLYPT